MGKKFCSDLLEFEIFVISLKSVYMTIIIAFYL